MDASHLFAALASARRQPLLQPACQQEAVAPVFVDHASPLAGDLHLDIVHDRSFYNAMREHACRKDREIPGKARTTLTA